MTSLMTRWAPIGAAVAVVAVVAGVTLLSRSDSRSDAPPLLRLAAGGTGEQAAAPSATGGVAAKVGAQGSSFRLVGTLPDGPDEARAYPLPAGPVARADVQRLAKALGLTGEPVRDGDGWRLGGLHVGASPGQPWQLSTCGPDSTVSSDGPVGCASSGSGSAGTGGTTVTAEPEPAVAAACPAAPPGAEPVRCDDTPPVAPPCPDNARCVSPDVGTAPPPPPPAPAPAPAPSLDPQVVRRAAAPMLSALGLSAAAVRVEAYGTQGSVTADPVVDGLATAGFSTRLDVDADGHLLGGGGYLAQPTRGAAYPLVSPREAFDALPEQPQRLMDCLDCPEPAPARVTGAQLGLVLTSLQDDEAALLPAWLFGVEGWPMPLAQNAVQERYLAPPEEPTGKRAPLGFDTGYPSDDPSTVIVQYGDSSSCPHGNVTHQAKESPESVVVVLEADAQPADQACTADYRQMLVPIELKSPLGSRTVIDGSRGEEVAVDRSCSRPMTNPAPPKDCVR